MRGDATGSYEKFNYLHRPSKQVERKLVIECLHRLSEVGYPISTYTYLGFGSVYYADFMMFHRYLYIDRMICVEHGPIPGRMRFNKPYGFIRLRMAEIGDVVPLLDRRQPYLVWLDYDYRLVADMLDDIGLLLSILPTSSVFLVTIDARPPRDVYGHDGRLNQKAADDTRRDLEFEFGRYLKRPILRRDLSPSLFPVLLSEVLRNHFADSIGARQDAKFIQLFNCRYADGAQMLTVGGMVGSVPELRQLRKAGVLRAPFTQTHSRPLEISVPALTVREKNWLDRNLSFIHRGGIPDFEIAKKPLKNFVQFYRHYPTYHETIL